MCVFRCVCAVSLNRCLFLVVCVCVRCVVELVFVFGCVCVCAVSLNRCLFLVVCVCALCP